VTTTVLVSMIQFFSPPFPSIDGRTVNFYDLDQNEICSLSIPPTTTKTLLSSTSDSAPTRTRTQLDSGLMFPEFIPRPNPTLITESPSINSASAKSDCALADQF